MMITKDSKYVIMTDYDEWFQAEMYDENTHVYLTDPVRKITDMFFGGDDDAYNVEHDKFTNTYDLFNDLKKIAEKQGMWLTPIYKKEHDFVYYGIGTCNGWDCGTCGFAVIDINKAKQDYKSHQDWLNAVSAYLDALSKQENGEIYDVTLLNSKTGKIIDSIGGVSFNDDETNEENLIEVARDNFAKAHDYQPDQWVPARVVTHISYEKAE